MDICEGQVFMKSKRYTEEFKKEAVKQVTERGYSVEVPKERRLTERFRVSDAH